MVASVLLHAPGAGQAPGAAVCVVRRATAPRARLRAFRRQLGSKLLRLSVRDAERLGGLLRRPRRRDGHGCRIAAAFLVRWWTGFRTCAEWLWSPNSSMVANL